MSHLSSFLPPFLCMCVVAFPFPFGAGFGAMEAGVAVVMVVVPNRSCHVFLPIEEKGEEDRTTGTVEWGDWIALRFMLTEEFHRQPEEIHLEQQQQQQQQEVDEGPVMMANDDLFLFCPYPNCGSMVDPPCFYDHCMESHAQAPRHDFMCPICVTFYGVDPATTNRTSLHLINHLRQAHADMAGVSAQTYKPVVNTPKPAPVVEEFYDIPDEYSNSNIGSTFAQFHLDRDMGSDSECAVCLENFVHGQSVVRMECKGVAWVRSFRSSFPSGFCLYHAHCVQLWWKKKSGAVSCPTHIHYDQDEDDE